MPKQFLSAVARRRITKMIDHVLAFPEQLNQNKFPDITEADKTYAKGPAKNYCGTSFCAAGHLIFATKPSLFKTLLFSGVNWEDEAIDFLKLGGKLVNTDTVFGIHEHWPNKFRVMYEKASTFRSRKVVEKRRAAAFAARWQDILDTDGRDLQYKPA